MKYFVAMFLMAISFPVDAGWVDVSGKVTKIITYAHTETILVHLSEPGLSVDACSNKTNFAISADMSEEGRARMYSMLLAAQATDRTVTLAVLDTGDCESWFSAPNVYRRIARMR